MDKISLEQAEDLLAKLQTSADNETKTKDINNVKSLIKRNNVPVDAISPLFDIVFLASQSQHPHLLYAGLSTLYRLLERLGNQDSKHLERYAKHVLPLLMDKIGDHKDKIRSTVLDSLTMLWRATSPDVERAVKNQALVSKNARAKETAMEWLVTVRFRITKSLWKRY